MCVIWQMGSVGTGSSDFGGGGGRESSGSALARLAGRVPSDADGRPAGRRQGHLGAAVVVEFAHAGATYHPVVGVSSSVCVPVPEAPDVAL